MFACRQLLLAAGCAATVGTGCATPPEPRSANSRAYRLTTLRSRRAACPPAGRQHAQKASQHRIGPGNHHHLAGTIRSRPGDMVGLPAGNLFDGGQFVGEDFQ